MMCVGFVRSCIRTSIAIPEGRGLFDVGLDRVKHGSVGPLADCATVAEVERFPWPDPKLT